jgi:uncharacterized protein (DUF305 family)
MDQGGDASARPNPRKMMSLTSDKEITMKARWIGVSGTVLVLIALVLGTLGSRLFPAAFWGNPTVSLNGPGMIANGMMGPGMMSGGMMSGTMRNGMMGGEVMGDPSQPFDQRFLDQMLMHHQGAVMSAQMMIADSARPELRDLAQRIIAAQQREIDQMQQWRNDWYGAAPMGSMPGMMNGAMMGADMMNPDQMRQMMGASVDFDRMFLQMMIPHHQAAISMAQQALNQVEHPEIKTLAQSIVTTQQAEIVEMQGYLRDWYGVQGQ